MYIFCTWDTRTPPIKYWPSTARIFCSWTLYYIPLTLWYTILSCTSFFIPQKTCISRPYCTMISWGLVIPVENPIPPKAVNSHRGMNTRGENWLLWKGPTVCHFICVLCHNFWTNYDLDLFSTSKWPSEPCFCERYLCKRRKIG